LEFRITNSKYLLFWSLCCHAVYAETLMNCATLLYFHKLLVLCGKLLWSAYYNIAINKLIHPSNVCTYSWCVYSLAWNSCYSISFCFKTLRRPKYLVLYATKSVNGTMSCTYIFTYVKCTSSVVFMLAYVYTLEANNMLSEILIDFSPHKDVYFNSCSMNIFLTHNIVQHGRAWKILYTNICIP